jgi:hypothetical protein
MTLNNPGTVRRTVDQQPADFQQVHDNFTAEAWKQWPNEAGVRLTRCSSLSRPDPHN